MNVELSEHPHFEELKPLFQLMHRAERRKTADWLIGDASEIAVNLRMADLKMGIK